MRVLHFIWSANFGGIEKLVITLAQQQQLNENIKVSLLIGIRKGNFLEMIEQAGLHCEFADMKSGLDFSSSKINRLTKLMSSYDVLHIHTFNPAIAYAAIKSKIKIVFTVHGNFGFGRKRTIKDKVLQFLSRYFIRNHVNHITYNSEFCRNIAMEFYKVKKSTPATLIYNAIPNIELPIQDENDPAIKIKSSDFIVGTASRFAGNKRIDRLIEAFEIFSKNKQDTTLLLTGDGVKMQELKNIVKIKKLENQVVFTGFKKNVFAWFKKMNVCVFPFENEAFGIVAIEALMLGKTVIVFSDGGGITEVIKPLNRLNIVESTAHLVDRLNFYYDNRNVLADEQNNNRQYASRFNISSNEKAYFDVYKEVLNNTLE